MPYKKERKPGGKTLEKLQRNSAARGAANMMNDADDDSRESDDMVWDWSEQGRNYWRNAPLRPSWLGMKAAFEDKAHGQSEPSGESSDILKIKSDGSHADGMSLTEFQVRPNLLPPVLSLATQFGMVGESQPPSRYVADPPAWFRRPQTAVTVYDAAQRQARDQQRLQQVHQTPDWGHQLTPVCANTLEDGQLDRELEHLQTLFSTLATVDENDADLFYDALTPEEMQISQQAGLPGLAPMKTPQVVPPREAPAPGDDLVLLKKTVEDFAWRVCAQSAGDCLKQLADDTHFEALIGHAPQLVNVVRVLVRERDALTLAEMAQRIGQALGDGQGDPAVQGACDALHTIAALLTTADALHSGRNTGPALIPSLDALTTLNRSPLASQYLAPATRENVALALDVTTTLLNTLADINPAGGNLSLTDAVGVIASSGVLEKIVAQAAPGQRWTAGAAEKLAQLYGTQAMNALLMPEASFTQQLSGLLALAQESGLDRDILDHIDRRLAPALSAAKDLLQVSRDFPAAADTARQVNWLIDTLRHTPELMALIPSQQIQKIVQDATALSGRTAPWPDGPAAQADWLITLLNQPEVKPWLPDLLNQCARLGEVARQMACDIAENRLSSGIVAQGEWLVKYLEMPAVSGALAQGLPASMAAQLHGLLTPIKQGQALLSALQQYPAQGRASEKAAWGIALLGQPHTLDVLRLVMDEQRLAPLVFLRSLNAWPAEGTPAAKLTWLTGAMGHVQAHPTLSEWLPESTKSLLAAVKPLAGLLETWQGLPAGVPVRENGQKMAAALLTAAKAWVVDRGMMAVVVKAYPPLAWLAPVCKAWERVPTDSGNVAFAKNLAIEIGKEVLGPMEGAWSVTRNLSYLKEGLKALHQMRNLYQTWSRDPVRAEQILGQALKPWENDARYQTGITLLKHLPALHQIDAQLARPGPGEAFNWHNAAQGLTLLHTTPSPLLQKTLRDLNAQATQAAAAFLTQGMTTLANSIDGTRVQQASTVAAAAGVGAMLGGVKGAAVGAALGAVMATQQGGAEAMPLDVSGLTAAREALGGYLQGEIDDTTDTGTPARDRLNSHKPEMIERYLNDYRALYAQRAQPEFEAMFKEGLKEAGLSSDPYGSEAWNSGPFISFVVKRLVDGQVRLPDNSQTGTMRNAFDAVGVFTFPRAAEVEAFGGEFLKKHLTGIATDSVSNEQVQQILLPAYMKDYRTLMANENDLNIQREMAFVRDNDSALKQASAETLWNSKEFSQHIMRELIKGTTKLLNQGELTGSANTMAAMLAGRTTSTTPPPPSDNAVRRDGSIIILPRAERVPLPPNWPVHLSVDSYITLLQHTFGEQLGKDPHVWWVDPENSQRYLPQDRCSLRNFLTTPFDHQLFHAGGNWSQELRDAVRLYRMSGALRQEAATTPAPISHDAQMAEIRSQYSKINALFRDPAVETKRNHVQLWLQQASGSLKPAPDPSSFNKNLLDGLSRAYGQSPEVWSQQQHMNLDAFNQTLSPEHKAILNNAAKQVVNTLQSELGKRMPVKDMLHLPASQVAENLASQYAKTQADGIRAALIRPPGPDDKWPAGVPNSRQLRQDIRTWHTASRIEQALSQRHYNDYVQHALRGSLDTEGVLDAIVEQRLRDAGITLKPDTPLTIDIKVESWLTSLMRMCVSPDNKRGMTVTLKELVLGTWRPAFMAKLGIIYSLTSPIAHHTPTIERAQVKSDNPATPGTGTVLTAGQIEQLTADITPVDFALDNLALYLNPDVRNSVTQSKIEKGSLAADRLLDDIQGGEIARTADDPSFEKAINKLTAFRNGEAVPHAVMMAKTREGTLPIKNLLCLPLSQDRVALLSQRTGEYLLTTPQALQSGEMTNLLKDDTKDKSLVKLLIDHMDTRQSFDSIVRHGNQMERYLNKSLKLAKFRSTQQQGRRNVLTQWTQMVAWEQGANVSAFKKDLRAAYQNQNGYEETLRPIIENLDRSPRDFARAIQLYSPLHPLEGIEVRMAALSGEAKAQPQAKTVADNLLWDVITLGRGVDHHTASGAELSNEQGKATREFIFSTAVAVAAGVATGGAGAALGLSKGAIFLMTVAVQAGLTGVEESIKAHLEVNEQQRDAAKDSVKYAVLLSIVGDGIMDKLVPAAWKLLKRAWKAGASADVLRSMASKLTQFTSDMTPLAKNWAASSPIDKNTLITDTVMGTRAAQRLGRLEEPEIRKQIETTLAQYRQKQAIDKQTFHDELMLAWDCLDRSRTPGNHLAPYMQEQQAPASTAYRTPESQLGEANLYRLSDEAAIKDFHAGSDANYDRLWQQAETQAEAYQRLYGSESAQAYRYYENGQQKISVKQPLPPGDTLGGLLGNGDNLAKALALVKTLESPAVAGMNPVNTLTNDLVTKLANKGIDCPTITRNNLSYDRASNTLSLSSMDNVSLADTVSPASKTRMQGQIRELLEHFPQAVEAQRNLALRGGGNIALGIRNKYDNYVIILKSSKKFSQPFNAGVEQFKRDGTLAHLVGKLPHNYQMMNDTQLMNEVFTDNPLKLTPHELGEVSEFIRLARKQAEIQEVALNAMTLAYQLTPETTRLSLHPQTLLTEAAGKGSRGRCRPLAYAMEVAIHNGRSEQMLENLGRVRAQVDLGAGRRYIEALDAFHDQNLEAIETAVTVGNHALLSVSEIVGQLKKESGAASFSLRTEIHAMSVGVSVKDNGAKRYHFYDPNIGLVEYSSPEALGKGLDKTIGNKRLADFYGADDGRYKLYRLDVAALADTPIARSPEWKIADFSERKQPDPTKWVRTDGRLHKAPVESVCHTGRGKRSLCNTAKNYQPTPALSMASMARPSKNIDDWGRDVPRFINDLQTQRVKVLFSLDDQLSFDMHPSGVAKDEYLKQQLKQKDIEYVIDPKNALEDGYTFAADADFTQPGLARDQVAQIASLVDQIKDRRPANPNDVVAVHCGAGDGRSGTVKSAVMIEKLLREKPELYRQGVVDDNKMTSIRTEISEDLNTTSNVDNPAYKVVAYAINSVRVTHHYAVERMSDVNLLNAYARFLLTYPSSGRSSQ